MISYAIWYKQPLEHFSKTINCTARHAPTNLCAIKLTLTIKCKSGELFE